MQFSPKAVFLNNYESDDSDCFSGLNIRQTGLSGAYSRLISPKIDLVTTNQLFDAIVNFLLHYLSISHKYETCDC